MKYFGFNQNHYVMKVRLAMFLLVLFGLSACTQYTCPTYSKKDVKKKEVVAEKERI
jgi:hypothetical protein